MTANSRGFTLLELVAALAIFAMLSVMAYGGLASVLKAREGLDSAYSELEAWQRAVMRLRADLGQVRARPIRDEFGDPQPAFHEPEDGRIEFTRGGRRNPLLLPRASLERVAYYLDTDGSLIRLSWRNLDRGPAEEPIRVKLMPDIQRLEWRFLGSDQEWNEDWPPLNVADSSRDEIPMPQALELRLETKRFGDLRFLFPVEIPA